MDIGDIRGPCIVHREPILNSFTYLDLRRVSVPEAIGAVHLLHNG